MCSLASDLRSAFTSIIEKAKLANPEGSVGSRFRSWAGVYYATGIDPRDDVLLTVFEYNPITSGYHLGEPRAAASAECLKRLYPEILELVSGLDRQGKYDILFPVVEAVCSFQKTTKDLEETMPLSQGGLGIDFPWVDQKYAKFVRSDAVGSYTKNDNDAACRLAERVLGDLDEGTKDGSGIPTRFARRPSVLGEMVRNWQEVVHRPSSVQTTQAEAEGTVLASFFIPVIREVGVKRGLISGMSGLALEAEHDGWEDVGW